jgi:hypothetical protein
MGPAVIRTVLAVFLTVAPTFARAADLLQCEETDSVGFHLEGPAPERVRFVAMRFTLLADLPQATVTVQGIRPWTMQCQGDEQVLSCSDSLRLLVIQRQSGQFAFSRLAGLVLAEAPTLTMAREPLSVSWGACKK